MPTTPDKNEEKDVLREPPRQQIVLVEDDADLRAGIAEYLSCIGYAVTAVNNGLNFYRALTEQTDFAAAIIDLGLPDIDGLQLSGYVRRNTDMRCIILTARDSVDSRVSGYDSGADLYMVKPVDCRELASALSSLLQRGQNDSGARKTKDWQLNLQNSTLITPSLILIPLTAREMDFLLCLSVSQRDTIPRTTILEKLGYANDDFSNRALESLIRRLRRKIETAFGSAPILTRHGVGYIFSAPLQSIN